MKKILTILLIFAAFVSFGQANKYRVKTQALILNGDTIKWFYTITADDTIVSKSYVDFLVAGLAGGHDILTLGTTATDGGMSLFGQELSMTRATTSQSGWVHYLDMIAFNNKLSAVSHDNYFTGLGTTASPLTLNTTAVKSWLDGIYLTPTGDLTGTFDGQTSSYYLDYNNFINTPVISDVAFGASWDANQDAATKNAIYDAIVAATGTVTDLTYIPNAAYGIMTSSTGTGDTIPARSSTYAGLMTPTDKSRLDGMGTDVFHEVPSGLINSLNTTYTIEREPIINTERIILNGVEQEKGFHYLISGDVITFTTPPESGSRIRAHYKYNQEIADTTTATASTSEVTNIGETTATAGGTITSDGNSSVTDRGVVLNTTGSPTVSDTKYASGTGTGSFTVSLTGLTAATTYYVRIYAVNGEGTSYGNQMIFTTTGTTEDTTTTIDPPTYTTAYYVSPTGSDSNNGLTEGTAIKTIDKVNTLNLSGGDAVLFENGGEYEGTIILSSSGTSSDPIVFSSYGTGDKAKIYGSEVLTGWTVYSGNIYRAAFNKTVNQVFLNDVKVRAARYPNSGYFTIDSVYTTTSFDSNELNAGWNYTGSKIFMRSGVYYTDTKTVDDEGTGTNGKKLVLNAAPKDDLNKHEGFFLMNKLNYLDQAGEWFSDGSYVYLWTPAGDSPANYEVRVSTENYGFYAHTKSNFEVFGLHFLQQANSSIYAHACDNVEIDNVDISYPEGYGIINDQYGGTNLFTVKNSIIEGANFNAIHLRVANSLIQDVTLREIATWDNLGLNGTGQYNYGNGTYVVGANNTFRYMTIEDVGYNGIFFAGSDNLIEYNFIDSVCLIKADGGGIYTTEPGVGTVSGTAIRYNIVLNVLGDPTGSISSYSGLPSTMWYGEGIYPDESAQNVTIEYNTVSGARNASIHFHDNSGSTATNNTLLGYRYPIRIGKASRTVTNTISNNIMVLTEATDNWQVRPTFYYHFSDARIGGDNNKYYNVMVSSDNVYRNDSGYRTLTQWKSDMSMDTNSTYSNSGLAAGEEIELVYNKTKSAKTYTVTGTNVRDLDNVTVASFTLQPFTSKVLKGTNISAQ